MRCTACGFDSPEGMKFCGGCGKSLIAAAAPPVERDTAERRQLTVMFCDLVGSTALSAQLDPEDLREVIRDYQRVATAAVERYEGHVAQHLGDGLLIYFGYPRAHEDDARRAVHAALGFIEAMEEPRERLRQRGFELAVRVGIHTGPVVAGDLGGGDTMSALALGQTPKIAAALESTVGPNRVALSAATHELVQGFFAFRPLGRHALKAAAEPMELYEVVSESGVRSRFDLAVRQGLGPLIGRRREFIALRDRFYVASTGEGRVVEIVGEGGIGKSRQVYELRRAVGRMPHLWLTCHCSPYAREDAFHPFFEHLTAPLGCGDEQSREFRRGELDSRRRQDLSALLLSRLLALSAEWPVVLFVEDLQWADSGTVAFLEQLTAAVHSKPVLAVLTFRPAFEPPWPRSAHVSRIELERLEDEEEEMMVEEVTGGKPLPTELLDQILTRADGVPLYIEELTRMVLDSGQLTETDDGHELPPGQEILLGIPTSLRDALMARLDNDPEAKEIAQLAAAFGHEFSFGVLRAVSRLDERELTRRLERLVAEDLLTAFGDPPEATYSFRHALIRQAAYESVLKSTRPQYHRGMAEALIELVPEVAESDPGLVARHLNNAKLPERAVPYRLRAARQALRRGDYRRAGKQLAKGLTSAAALPPAERPGREIAFHCALGVAHAAGTSWQGAEAVQACARANELCRESAAAENAEHFWTSHGLWQTDLYRPDVEAALVSARRLPDLARRLEDPEALRQAHLAQGGTRLFHGDFDAARGHLEKAQAIEEEGTETEEGAVADGWLLTDSRVVSRAWMSLVLWFLGHPDRALNESVEAIGVARRLQHPYSLAYALYFGAWLHVCRREAELARDCAEELHYLASKHELHLAVAARFLLDLRAVNPGEGPGPRGALPFPPLNLPKGTLPADLRHARVLPGFPAALGQTAAATLVAGQAMAEGRLDEAADLLAHAFDQARGTGELYWQAELHRCRGELYLAEDPDAPRRAELSFERALGIARAQGTRALELRAATSLARLWAHERRDEARGLLVIQGSFDEGLETADLLEAHDLLRALGP